MAVKSYLIRYQILWHSTLNLLRKTGTIRNGDLRKYIFCLNFLTGNKLLELITPPYYKVYASYIRIGTICELRNLFLFILQKQINPIRVRYVHDGHGGHGARDGWVPTLFPTLVSTLFSSLELVFL